MEGKSLVLQEGEWKERVQCFVSTAGEKIPVCRFTTVLSFVCLFVFCWQGSWTESPTQDWEDCKEFMSSSGVMKNVFSGFRLVVVRLSGTVGNKVHDKVEAHIKKWEGLLLCH